MASERSKHIDIMYHFARERVMMDEVKFEYCPTYNMLADFLTKVLSAVQFERLKILAGIH